ncbi:MAG TPA: hypothetical protein VN893_22565 [Bryobacteraceae bacterium]|nr:hypothetical protein [Bryobacteraceae bacterium]
MPRIRLRYWLPVANLAIDAALLGMMAWSLHGRTSRAAPPRSIRPVAFFEEGQAAVGWDDVTVCGPLPRPIGATNLGTLPVAIASQAVPWWRNGLNFRWVCLHEGLAVAFWFGIGWLAESPPRRRWVLGYLGLLAVSVPASLSSVTTEFFALAMLVVWAGAGIMAIAWGLRSSVRMVRRPN